MASGRLPNLLVAGVPKAGTGSLFAYLSQHPDICRADEKEVGYWNYYNPRRHSGAPPPLDDYRKHFAACGEERYAFEATPTYSYGGQPVIDAIRTHLPEPKILISLRNPVDRLWSAYTFQRELGNLARMRSFEEYLHACEQRKRDGSDLVPHDHLHGLYIGYYADYVPLWLDAFGKDIRVIFAEHTVQDPAKVMAGLLRWLDVDEAAVSDIDLGLRNTTQHPRSTRVAKLAYSLKRSGDRLRLLPPRVRAPLRRIYQRANAGKPPEKMTADVRRYLTGLYRESNEQTARALSAHGYQDLPDWLRVGFTGNADAGQGAITSGLANDSAE